MQERYEVARVKTDSQFGEQHKFDRREIYSVNGSKNIVIVFGAALRRRMRGEKWTNNSCQITFERLWFGHLSGDAQR